ncbi:hypothetical protein NQZ68_004084 [Dissostichus eleginoides]|nr:hypothetical protein NQZ68_004084 [Dissostichus eleginoides]
MHSYRHEYKAVLFIAPDFPTTLRDRTAGKQGGTPTPATEIAHSKHWILCMHCGSAQVSRLCVMSDAEHPPITAGVIIIPGFKDREEEVEA